MNSTYSVRLGVSMTRDEKHDMTLQFGRSHAARISRSLKGWIAGSCTCHELTWSTSDLEYHWGGVDAPILCPLSR
jgi:hypothetical protein